MAKVGGRQYGGACFNREFSFEPTVSRQIETTAHDGVFAIAEEDVPAYLSAYAPQPLRSSKATAGDVDLPFRNFGTVKGLTFERGLIFPTTTITAFLTNGTELKAKTACGLYVAVTRAKHSVAIVVPDPTATTLTPWDPASP